MLKGVLDMAGDLGLVTVCEGVETEEQASMLRELGCPVAQGYVFSQAPAGGGVPHPLRT